VEKLSALSVARLSACARLVAARVESSGESRAELEQTLDLLYGEIATRDEEISQNVGILGALMRKVKHG
jgi:hypothetical protein